MQKWEREYPLPHNHTFSVRLEKISNNTIAFALEVHGPEVIHDYEGSIYEDILPEEIDLELEQFPLLLSVTTFEELVKTIELYNLQAVDIARIFDFIFNPNEEYYEGNE